MGQNPSRVQHMQRASVAIQLRYGGGAVSETVTLEYFDAAELLRLAWSRCVQLARAHELLLEAEPGSSRIWLRAMHAENCFAGSDNLINLIEQPQALYPMLRFPATASRLSLVADLLSADAAAAAVASRKLPATPSTLSTLSTPASNETSKLK